LPDGAEVEVVVIDDVLNPQERAALHPSLDRAVAIKEPLDPERDGARLRGEAKIPARL
jgi:hypothetical protein